MGSSCRSLTTDLPGDYSLLELLEGSFVECNSEDNANVPEGMRTTAKPVQPVGFPFCDEDTFGEVGGVDEEAGEEPVEGVGYRTCQR